MPTPTCIQKICDLWKADEVHGIELLWDSGLLALRCVSVSYWSKDDGLNWFLDKRGISNTRIWRDSLVDLYCIFQLVVLLGVLFCFRSPRLSSWVAAYVLFEIYLNLFNIVFLSRRSEIGLSQSSKTPVAINEPSTSVERSILLLFVNVLQVTVAFAVFYRGSIQGLIPSDAFRDAVFVFGTLGSPLNAPGLLVALQVFLDFLLVAVILGSFVGQAGPFAKK